MDIVKAFNANDLHTEIVIKGTIDDPLFRASDVGVILEINNIRMSMTDFDESEKRAVSSTDSTGRMQEVTFLTEKGLYRGTKFPLIPLLDILMTLITRQEIESESIHISTHKNEKKMLLMKERRIIKR